MLLTPEKNKNKSHCEKEKVNFSRNEIIELERRIALLGRYIIHRIKRGTMRIIIADSMLPLLSMSLFLLLAGPQGQGQHTQSTMIRSRMAVAAPTSTPIIT